jgi:hypothetical protein
VYKAKYGCQVFVQILSGVSTIQSLTASPNHVSCLGFDSRPNYWQGWRIFTWKTLANETIQVRSGVVFATAKALASASNTCQVILTSRSLSKGNAVKAKIEAGGIKIIFSAIQFDAIDEVSVSEAVVHV